MNNFNIDDKKLNGLLNMASQKLGIPAEKIKASLQSGKTDELLSQAKNIDKNKINQLLSNPNIQKQLMESPKTQEMLKKIMKEK